MRRSFAATGVLLLVLGTAFVAIAQPPTISPEQLAERLAGNDPPTVLDVRSDQEWSQGHIPGAMHIPVQVMTERRDEVPLDRDVVVHCQVAPRARMAEKMLIMIGHERVFHLEGGFQAWSDAGLEVEK